jgi:NADH:ubiquinone oxidoreductase subunit E
MKKHLSVCVGSKCRKKQAIKVFDFLQNYLEENSGNTELKAGLCRRVCEEGPLIEMDNMIFPFIDEKKSLKIIEASHQDNFDKLKEFKPFLLKKV